MAAIVIGTVLSAPQIIHTARTAPACKTTLQRAGGVFNETSTYAWVSELPHVLHHAKTGSARKRLPRRPDEYCTPPCQALAH